MGYRIKWNESVADGLRRVASEQLEKAIAEVGDASLSRADAVHQVRKRCKKIRAAARLIRPENRSLYREENAFFRELAGDLSAVRDLDAMLETLDALVSYFGAELDEPAFQSVREKLRERREIAVAEEAEDNTFDDLGETLEAARVRVDAWDICGEGFDAVAGGMLKTYRRGRDAMGEAFECKTAEAFREWRKRAKCHWYHMRLLREVWKEPMEGRCKALDELADILGDEHDLAVFRGVLTAGADEFGGRREVHMLLALIDRRREMLQTEAAPLGERLFVEKPKQFVKRIGGYWRVWRKQGVSAEIE